MSACDLAATSADPDDIGPTVVAIPIRTRLAAARIAHAADNVREAQAIVDEAIGLLATVRGRQAEIYQLGAAQGALRETIELLAHQANARPQGGDACADPPPDLKSDPTYEEIAIWVSFGVPLTS